MRRVSRALWLPALGAMLAAGSVTSARAAERMVVQGNVTYISGGVGVHEQEQLDGRAGEFNLKLVFTLVEGNYLADIGVLVSDAKGRRIVEHQAGGPYFMAKLPAGQYSVTATYDGRALTRKVSLGARGLRTEYFRWPSNPETDFPLPRERSEEPRPAARPGAGNPRKRDAGKNR